MRTSILSATSMATALVAFGAPARGAAIYSITDNDATAILTGTTWVVGDTVSNSGIGYTYIDGKRLSSSLSVDNLTKTKVTTSATVTAGTAIGLSLSSVPGSIKGGRSDNFNVRVQPVARGALTGAFDYSAYDNKDFTSASPDLATITVATTAVAPVAQVTAAPVYLLAGSSGTATTDITITNVGDGNLSGLGAASNLAAATNTAALATGWAGKVADTGALADAAASTAGTLTYTAQATRQTNTTTVTSVFANGNPVADASGTVNQGFTATTTVVGQTVAPQASVTATLSAGTIRAGTSASVALRVQNTGDGNLAGADNGTSLLTNLRGSVAAGAGAFQGSGGAVNLTDATSQSYSFTYAPTARGTDGATIATTLDNGATSGNHAGTATTTLSGTAVGPQYTAALDTQGNTLASGTQIVFGDFANGIASHTLLLGNISADLATAALTNMTITAEIIGDAASEFSFTLSGFFTGDTAAAIGPATAVLRNLDNGADLGEIAVQFVAKAGWSTNAQLRIQTDEDSALGTMGSHIYVYDLVGTVPEPGTVMVLGTGLLGLAIARRRRAASLTAAENRRKRPG